MSNKNIKDYRDRVCQYCDYTAEGIQLKKDINWEKIKDSSFSAAADTNFVNNLARNNNRSLETDQSWLG